MTDEDMLLVGEDYVCQQNTNVAGNFVCHLFVGTF